MIRILVTDGMEKSAVSALRQRGYEVTEQFYGPDELGKQLQDFDAVVVRSATKLTQPILETALETGRLKLIVRGGVGIDNIDSGYARAHGVEVRNTPNASSASVAGLAVGFLFSLSRSLYDANKTMHEGKWEKKKYAKGIELAGKTLGLIGLGRIGKIVAQTASALGMKVQYTNKTGHKPENEPFRYVSFDELIRTSDFISLHMPKADGPLLGKAQFDAMKDGVMIVNTARGALIDEGALLDALDAGKVASAALDVFTEEPTKNERLIAHPNVCLTPHIGASTVEAQERIGEEIVSILTGKFN